MTNAIKQAVSVFLLWLLYTLIKTDEILKSLASIDMDLIIRIVMINIKKNIVSSTHLQMPKQLNFSLLDSEHFMPVYSLHKAMRENYNTQR